MQLSARPRDLVSIALPDGWASVRRPALLVAVLGALYLVLAGLVATSVTAALDDDLWDWFDTFNRPGAAHLAIRFVYRVGQFAYVLVAVALVSGLLSWRRRTWRPFLAAIGTMGVLDVLMLGFKFPLGRSYPHTGLNTVFGSGESFQAFPSGHAAHATIGMLVLASLTSRALPPGRRRTWWGMRPWTVVVAALLAVGAGVVNVVQGYHWPTDVLGGWIIGLAMFVVAHTLLGQGTAWSPGPAPTPSVRDDGAEVAREG